MIHRDLWETSVKEVRQKILSKTNDPEFRLIAAGVMDAAFDSLWDELFVAEKFHDAVTLTSDQYDQASDHSLKVTRETVPTAPDWLENILDAFSSQLKCNLFYPEKED